MPVSAEYRPEPRFFALGSDYADAVRAAEFPKTILRYRNDRAAAEVGLETLSEAEWIAAFGRFDPLPGQPGPLAMRCLLYTSPSPRDGLLSRMPSSA